MKGLKKCSTKFKMQTVMRKNIFRDDYSCLVCGKEVPKVDEFGICESCEPNVIHNDGKRCYKCAAPLQNESDYCLMCQNNERYFSKAFSPLLFKGDVRELVLSVKYGTKQYAFFPLARYLFREIENSNIEFDIVAFVPQNWKSAIIREINLSKRFAETVAGKYEKPLYRGITATSRGEPRHLLKGADRRKNFSHIFKLTHGEVLLGKRILLVDDIMTTGTTASSVALALRKAKPKSIEVLTLCH